MDAKNLLLKKPSGAKCTSKPHDLPIFFLDRHLGKQKIAEIRRMQSTQIEVHGDHFLSNAKDWEWLPKVGKKDG